MSGGGGEVNKRLCNNRRTRGRFEVMGAIKNGTRDEVHAQVQRSFLRL